MKLDLLLVVGSISIDFWFDEDDRINDKYDKS